MIERSDKNRNQPPPPTDPTDPIDLLSKRKTIKLY